MWPNMRHGHEPAEIPQMTADEIIRLMAAAAEYQYRVAVYPDGRVEVGPRNPTNAERQAAYRARKQAEPEAAPPPPPEPAPPEPAPPEPTPAPSAKPRRSYGPEAGAEAVAVHAKCGPRVAAAWDEWQVYRQDRASHPSSSLRIPWTVQAARLSAAQVERAASTYGPDLVADRITTAIAGNWQGLNFDKIQHTHDNHRRSNSPNRNGSQSRPPDSAAAAALDADFFPDGPG